MGEPRYLLAVQARRPRRDAVTGTILAPDPETPRIGTIWRLLGPNNRELGRSAQAYSDAATARAGIGFLRRQLDHLDARVGCDSGGTWTWRLDLDGRPVAIAARSYQRRREATFNLAQFLAAAPTARAPGESPAAPEGTGGEADELLARLSQGRTSGTAG
ncbi:MAG: hypothetical protein ACT4PP_16915 [Sporichthyaceae bacterium]